MTATRFESIRTYIQFADNEQDLPTTNSDHDPAYKTRYLMETQSKLLKSLS